MVKICFAASTGGHFEQLMMLYPVMEKHDSFILTEKTKYNYNEKKIKQYDVIQLNRKELLSIVKIIVVILQSILIFFKEKPDIVISTGALATIPICLLAKTFNRKVIFIESFSKINSPTKTGKFLYKYSDVFIVQWEDMLKYYPDAIYGGGIY